MLTHQRVRPLKNGNSASRPIPERVGSHCRTRPLNMV